METIRFIHTADLHLGSPLKSIGHASETIRDMLYEASYNSLSNIVTLALRESVDFVLISGDLYDGEARSIKVNKRIAEEFTRLHEADIPVYIIAGNHDPVTGTPSSAIALPANTVIFSSEEVETYEYNRNGQPVARILGQSYRGSADSRKMYSSYTVPDTSIWNIGLLHTALSEQATGYVPCTKEDLISRSDMHYWALGHTHQEEIINKDYPLIAYPGIPQGRDVGELGPGSILMVELSPHSPPDLQSIPVGEIIWDFQSVDIGKPEFIKASTLDDLTDLLRTHIDNLSAQGQFDFPKSLTQSVVELQGTVIRWHIRGRGRVHEHLAKDRIQAADYITDSLRETFGSRKPFIWCESTQIHTGPELPILEDLSADYEFFSHLESIINDLAGEEQLPEDVHAALGNIWDASMDEEDPDPERFQLDEDTFNGLLQDAQLRVIEAILEKRKDL